MIAITQTVPDITPARGYISKSVESFGQRDGQSLDFPDPGFFFKRKQALLRFRVNISKV